MKSTKLKSILKDKLKLKSNFTTQELVVILEAINPQANPKTHSWKIYQLKKEGYINQVGRGLYSFSFKPDYKPELSLKAKRLNNRIKNLIELSGLAIWETKMYEDLVGKPILKEYTFVMVPKDEMEPLFNEMLGFSKKVILNPNKEIIQRYLLPFDEAIIITPLLSELPLIETTDYITPALEGILVNFWFKNEDYLKPLGIVLEEVYKYAFKKYNVNQSKLLRYAARRDKRNEIESFIRNIL